MNEIKEFMELATNSTKNDSEAPISNEKSDVDLTIYDDDEIEIAEESMAFTQWTKVGHGLAPVGATIKAIDAGVYFVQSTDNGPIIVPKAIVTDRLLKLPDSKSSAVIDEVNKFWKLKDKFLKFGFTHKRGVLLWGPPGSGKTATVAIIIKQMIDDGGVVLLGNNTHPSTLSLMLSRMRQVEPDRNVVVVLEDIDTIIADYGETEVLSLLDGESSINNVVFIATTNYPENLDGRVVNRPSRFDRIVKIGMPNAAARKMYLESRQIQNEINIDDWVNLTEGFSLAHIKELIVSVLCYGNELEAESQRLREMFNAPSSADLSKKMGFDSGASLDLESCDDD